MRRRRIALLAAGLFAFAAAAGCQSVGPAAWTALDGGRGDFQYVAGRASRTYAAPTAQVLPAVLGAMDDLRIRSVRQINEPGAVALEATTADNRNASVTLRPGPGGTRLDARIGLLGDEPLSRALADRIAIRLEGATDADATPTIAEADATTSTPAGNPYFSRTAVSDIEILKGSGDAHFQDHPSP